MYIIILKSSKKYVVTSELVFIDWRTAIYITMSILTRINCGIIDRLTIYNCYSYVRRKRGGRTVATVRPPSRASHTFLPHVVARQRKVVEERRNAGRRQRERVSGCSTWGA